MIDRAWLVNPETGEIVEVKLSKESQIRMCGNSVCPDVAEALVRANNPEMAVFSPEERRARMASAWRSGKWDAEPQDVASASAR